MCVGDGQQVDAVQCVRPAATVVAPNRGNGREFHTEMRVESSLSSKNSKILFLAHEKGMVYL